MIGFERKAGKDSNVNEKRNLEKTNFYQSFSSFNPYLNATECKLSLRTCAHIL